MKIKLYEFERKLYAEHLILHRKKECGVYHFFYYFRPSSYETIKVIVGKWSRGEGTLCNERVSV